MLTQLLNQGTGYLSQSISLVAVGQWVRQKGILSTIGEQVKVSQKTVVHSPLEKLTDLLAMLLTGGKSLSVAHERLKSDEAAQRGFGRSGCADPSGIQQTLDACTPETVRQMKEAVKHLYQTHSQGYRHPYQQTWQLLDIDLNGRPCG